jgi:nitrogen fixation/metabolism regulation signal transduction histidine kinase
MRETKTSHTSTAGLISIILLYALIIILILIFSNQMLKDIAEGRTISQFLIIPLAVVLPIFLIGSIIYNIVKLFRQRKKGYPGVRFKIRLILFFTFIALLSSIPQGILSLSFLDTTINSWFSPRLGQALRGGLNIALEYHNDHIQNLKSLNESNVLTGILRDIDRRPQRIYENLTSIDQSIKSVQIFTSDGEKVLFQGDERGRIEFDRLQGAQDGLLPREATQDITILRAFNTFQHTSGTYYVVISKLLPEDFDQQAKHLTGALAIFQQLDRYQNLFRLVLVGFFFFFSFPILLLSILVSFILSEEVMRPLVHLEEATKKVTQGDFSIRILSRPHDELSLLIRSFNQMVSELERSRIKTMQTEKVSAWQEIAQRMAHEIKNPLTPIKLSAQRILRKYQGEDEQFERILNNSVSSIIREVENLNTMLQEFRDFARLPAPEPQQVNLRELIDEVVSTYSPSYPQMSFRTEDIAGEITLLVDRKQIYQVFANLFKNGIDATDGQGELTLRADLVTKGNLHYCRVQVQDNGSGIEEQEYDQVFNPYFTTKRDGTGLGLPIVERIVSDHKGQIWFESAKDIGTTFYIDLPVEGK